MRFVRLTAITFGLSFYFLATANASPLSWGFQRVTFKGPRTQVLLLTDQVIEAYKTDIGEKLINDLFQKRPTINVSIGMPGDLVLEKEKEYWLSGSDYSVENVFDVLATISAETRELPSEVNEENLLKQLESERQEDYSFKEFLTIRASATKLGRMLKALEEIESYPLGQKLFDDMEACGKHTLLVDDKMSLSGGGYAGAVKSSRGIFEGEGGDAKVRFRFDQPVAGSHIVKSLEGEIHFTYLDNIFHELVHAKHIMCGTLSPHTSEAQAIVEENAFRASRPETSDWSPRDYRKYEEGKQVWFGLFFDDENEPVHGDHFHQSTESLLMF